MPRVNGKEFPYTEAGRKAAGAERRKAMNKGKLPGLDKMPKDRAGMKMMMK